MNSIRKKIIGVDLDDVLAQTIPTLTTYHNAKFGTSLQFEDFTSYHWHEVWGGTHAQAIQKSYEFFMSGIDIPPYPEAQEVLHMLQNNYKLILITSRQKEYKKITHEWLTKYFFELFSDVVITNHAQWSFGGKSKTKKEVCIEKNVQIMIEDNLEYASECADVGVRVFLIDKPWNQGVVPSGVIRVKNWHEILNHPIVAV